MTTDLLIRGTVDLALEDEVGLPTLGTRLTAGHAGKRAAAPNNVFLEPGLLRYAERLVAVPRL